MRTVSTIAFALLGVMIAASPASAQWDRAQAPVLAGLMSKDVLSADDLVLIADAVEAGQAGDLSGLIGRPFVAVVTPDKTSAEGPRWWYDSAHQALSLHAPIGPLSGRYFRLSGCAGDMTMARGIEIRRTNSRQAVPGQTPDGDTERFDRVEQHRVSLGWLTCGRSIDATGLNTDIQEDGHRALGQLASIQATVEGTLEPVDGDAIAACAGEQLGATSDQPTELVVHQCVVGAFIRRISFIANGVELAHWTTKGLPPAHRPRRRWIRLPELPALPAFPALLDFH
jgi:hypothetical protein